MRLEYLVRWRPAVRQTRNNRCARLQRELAKNPVHVRYDRGRRTDETGNLDMSHRHPGSLALTSLVQGPVRYRQASYQTAFQIPGPDCPIA